MPIEFLCQNCSQQLRVPDTAAGKNARCPKCSTILAVPASTTSAAPASLSPLSPPPQPGFNFGAAEPKPASNDPFGGGAPGGSFGAPPPKNPFGDSGAASPFGGSGGSGGVVNPYASPAAVAYQQSNFQTGPVGHRVVEIGTIMNHAMAVWQNNLGLLVGMTFVVFLLTYGVAYGAQGIQYVLRENGQPELALVTALVFLPINFVLPTFLGIGQVQICLKLARGQRAEFSDLFGGGSRLLSALGLSLLIGLVTVLTVVLCFLPMIPLALFFWPCYYLVVDNKAPVMESFSVAARITEGNKLTTFLIWLLAIGIALLGFLAVFIGLLFAIPLMTVLWATAYLMMSNQLGGQPGYGQSAAPQPMYR